jgi:hypothetical protein
MLISTSNLSFAPPSVCEAFTSSSLIPALTPHEHANLYILETTKFPATDVLTH